MEDTSALGATNKTHGPVSRWKMGNDTERRYEPRLELEATVILYDD